MFNSALVGTHEQQINLWLCDFGLIRMNSSTFALKHNVMLQH